MPKQKIFTAADIRYELYGVHNELQVRLNEHLSSSVKDGGKHETPCWACNMWKDRQHGVAEAIRHFGGRVRR
jgi:hypothetical protein